ncbi:MAG: RNase adapter RapZ [Vicinamibacteria bacterium]|nr:RNase adapter RapZ [Vicinamibacteria bacterium]
MAARRRSLPQLLIITGLSGSGKTSVSRALEDAGWFCVDNLPTTMIPRFVELIRESRDLTHFALVVDVRERDFLKRFPSVLRRLRRNGTNVSVLFLEAGERILLRRFSETRRPHPLGGFAQPPIDSVREEQHTLRAIRKMADLILDTSEYTVHQLRDHIRARYDISESRAHLALSVTSFGFRHGLPAEADLVFDVRFLPNPNFVPELKRLTGRHPRVVRYLRRQRDTAPFLKKLASFLGFTLPRYSREGKSHLTIAVGCTGGKHRSVMIAMELSRILEGKGYHVNVRHRDMRLS